MAGSKSVLIVNPNSTESMTKALEPLIAALGLHDTRYTYFTAKSGPESINGEDDAAESAEHCLADLRALLPTHDAVLICCYSEHPLVGLVKAEPEALRRGTPVTGIFEASVGAALQAVAPGQRFGIVSTGKVWETLLTDATMRFLGTAGDGGARFAGVETTGLTAVELHGVPAGEVRTRMKEAARRLVRRGQVGAVCLGCAGMAGMDGMVREACIEELGERDGKLVKVIDGVAAGAAWLEGAMRIGF